MSGCDEFFDELEKGTVGESDRLAQELRAHLEDSGAKEPRALGTPTQIAALFNRVRFERDWPAWVLSTALLGAFALVIQLLTVWIVSGFLSQAIGRLTRLPMAFAINPSGMPELLVYALAFPWIYVAFWRSARQAFRFTGNTKWTSALAAWLVLLPIGANAFSRIYDLRASDLLPLDIAVFGILVLTALVSSAWIARHRKISVRVPPRIRNALWVVLLALVVLTSVGFGMRDADGALASGLGFPTALYPLFAARELFESAVGNVVAVFLGFLSPPAMWNLVGITLTAWWVACVLRFGRQIRARTSGGFPFATVVALVYLTSILSAGATDVPDVEFRVPVSSVSLRIERSEIWTWPNLHRYFNRTSNVFPFYHSEWNETRGEFLVEQSSIRSGMDTLLPVAQWHVRAADRADDASITDTGDLLVQPGGWGTRGPDGKSITPPEPDDDDATLNELEAQGIFCDTDEPFPSCFRLSYGTKEIFSHSTRSVIVTQAIVTPDERWMLLTLTTRHGGNEYVYLVDLQ